MAVVVDILPELIKNRLHKTMVKIRLRRVGAKNRPHYRVVVADSRASRDGAFIETIGYYHPLTEPATVVINEAEALKWLSRGAQPSEPVAKMLDKLGILAKFETSKTAQPQIKEAINEGID
jgi:small subunit ribosomal protein S16